MLSTLIREDLITTNLDSNRKEAVIKELCELFSKAGVIKDLDEFIETIKKRERIESTAIGEGIAIPHGRSNTVKELAIAFGSSKKGVDFHPLDGKPVHLIFMVAAPKEAGKEYLQAVARVARFLKEKDLKKKLLEATTKEDILEAIREFDSRFPEIRVETKQGRTIYKR